MKKVTMYLIAGLVLAQNTFSQTNELYSIDRTIDKLSKSPLKTSVRKMNLHLGADYNTDSLDDLDTESLVSRKNIEELTKGIQPVLKISYNLTRYIEYGVILKENNIDEEPNWYSFLSLKF